MDTVLILIVLVMIITIGYILSKPFMKDAAHIPEMDQPINQHPQNGIYTCPKCGSPVLPSDKFCTHCGHHL